MSFAVECDTSNISILFILRLDLDSFLSATSRIDYYVASTNITNYRQYGRL